MFADFYKQNNTSVDFVQLQYGSDFVPFIEVHYQIIIIIIIIYSYYSQEYHQGE